MRWQLYFHPLASYCWKALIGLYESGIEFEPHIVDLGDPEQRAELVRLWPFAKFPVLRDTVSSTVTPESSILLETLALAEPSARWLLPADPARALQTRALDRFFDNQIHEPMQAIVGDRLRAEGQHDPVGVAAARAKLATAYAYANDLIGDTWPTGEFSLADCAAYPALYYANRVSPLASEHGALKSYLERLTARPSVQKVMDGAGPYLQYFPE